MNEFVKVVKEIVYTSSTKVLDTLMFGDRERAWIEEIVAKHLSTWIEISTLSTPSISKLVDLEWKVNVKSIGVPTAIVQLTIQHETQDEKVFPPSRDIQFEMDANTLNVMLDGLGGIKQQLAMLT